MTGYHLSYLHTTGYWEWHFHLEGRRSLSRAGGDSDLLDLYDSCTICDGSGSRSRCVYGPGGGADVGRGRGARKRSAQASRFVTGSTYTVAYRTEVEVVL
jgi:hypothetical protein